MRILAIETSCDETAAAVIENGKNVLSNIVSSMQSTFSLQGGVIPEEAARKQVELILPVIGQSLSVAQYEWKDIDAIAVTKGPGLLGSLLVGTTAARTLSQLYKKPLLGVHHTLGHLSSTWLAIEDDPVFPILTLSASGGHTDLWLRTSHTHGQLLGSTRDDAAGEAFDKGAQLLGLPYPGGPSISKEATNGNPDAFHFPLPLKKESGFEFSFSGMKTALRYTLQECDEKNLPVADLAASFQKGICTHLLDRIEKALDAYPDIQEVHCVGGVSANIYLREELKKVASPKTVRVPQKIEFCTDNAAMIGAAAYFLITENAAEAVSPFQTKATSPLSELLAA